MEVFRLSQNFFESCFFSVGVMPGNKSFFFVLFSFRVHSQQPVIVFLCHELICGRRSRILF